MAFPHYKQLEQKDCGATCLKMIAKYYGKSFSLQELRDLCGSGKDGISVLDLSRAAEQIHLRSYVCEINFTQLLQKISLPCVIHWNNNHFLVVYKVSKSHIWVSDPAKKRLKFRHAEFKKKWLHGDNQQTGIAIAFEPLSGFSKVASSKEDNVPESSNFQQLLNYLKPYKKQLVQVGVIMVVVTLLQSSLPFIFRVILDVGIGRSDTDFIQVILIANVALIASIALANYIRDWLLKHIGARLSITLISDYLIKLLKMPLHYFETRSSGDILNRVRDHDRIKHFLLHHLVGVVFAALSFTAFSAILLNFNSMLFFVFFGGTAIYVLWVMLFMRVQERLDWNFYDLNSKNQAFWIESLASIVDIKINDYAFKKRRKWEKVQSSLYHLNQKTLQLEHYQNIGAQLINGVKNAFLIFISANAVIQGEMTVGMMISVQFILGFLNAPIQQLISFIQQYVPAKVSFMRLNDIQSQEDEETKVGQGNFSLPTNGTIRLREVSFKYNVNEPLALSNINLTLPPGKTTAIVGMSGSGKSTLLKLILRLYPPSQGDLLINENNVNQYTLPKWKSHCSAVLQEGSIFNDSFINNIVLDDDAIDYAYLEEILVAVQLKEVLDQLPFGYYNYIGEDGRSLSQGQKQRILLARALYRNPRVLILDEATNALDSINERKILTHLNAQDQNRTIVVAAHRMSTIKNADQIIVMNKGSIAERGTHEKLMARKSHYYRLITGREHNNTFHPSNHGVKIPAL